MLKQLYLTFNITRAWGSESYFETGWELVMSYITSYIYSYS